MSLSYKLPASICRKIQLENVRVDLQVGNLWYWAANNAGIDPDYYLLDTYIDRRKDYFGASYSVGLNINF